LLPQTEAVMYILSMNEVSTDLKFTHVTTTPLEEWPAFDRNLPLNKFKDRGIISKNRQYSATSDLDSNIIFSHAIRTRDYPNLRSWRTFLESALTIAKDQILCPLSVDATTLFGLRPPELSFVRQQGLYHKWFKRQHIQLTCEQQKNYVESLNEYITQACHSGITNVSGLMLLQ